MDATNIAKSIVEKQLRDKMQEILDIVAEHEPGHGIIDIAIDDGYFSLRCIGKDGTELHRLLNFSRHEKEAKESFIIRDVPYAPGIEIVNDEDMSPEEYRIWNPRPPKRHIPRKNEIHQEDAYDDNGRARAKPYVKSKPRKDGRMVMITTGEMVMD